MEATATAPAPPVPASPDYRAELHRLIDRIQDAELLRALWLLTSQAAPAIVEELELSPAWKKQIDLAIEELDAGKGIPAAEVFAQLLPAVTP